MKKVVMMLTAMMAIMAQAQTTTFRGELQVSSNWNNTKTDGSTIRETFSDLLNYENLGVASTNTANRGDMTKIIVRKGTLTNDVSVTYNLGSIVNSFGDTVAFTKVKFVGLLIGGATETNTVYQLGGAASDQFSAPFGSATDYIKVSNEGFAMLLSPTRTGYIVGTGTNLMIKNISTGTSTNSTYTLWIGGL